MHDQTADMAKQPEQSSSQTKTYSTISRTIHVGVFNWFSGIQFLWGDKSLYYLMKCNSPFKLSKSMCGMINLFNYACDVGIWWQSCTHVNRETADLRSPACKENNPCHHTFVRKGLEISESIRKSIYCFPRGRFQGSIVVMYLICQPE